MLLSSLNNSKPVGDWTPIVPRRVAPHLGQSAACSPTWLPHFQQYTIEFSRFRQRLPGLSLTVLRRLVLMLTICGRIVYAVTSRTILRWFKGELPAYVGAR